MQRTLGIAVAAATLSAMIAGAAAADTIKITIKGFKFIPAAVTAHVGDTIVWTNEDAMAHTTTAKSKAWDLPVAAGASASLAVSKAGAFDYFCKIHPSMLGKVTVE